MPIFIEYALQMLVGNADQIMVGWHDPNGVGAIGNANQITNLLIIVFSVVCTASMILIAQYLGAEDTSGLPRLYSVSLLTNIVFGGVVSLLLYFGAPLIFHLMGVKPEFFDSAVLYLRIVGGGMVFQSVFLTFTAFFRSNQMMLQGMAASVTMNLLNLVGNVILINGLFGLPALGVAGAAISSVISRIVGVAVIAAMFLRRMPGLLSLKALRPFPAKELKKLLGIGFPTGVYANMFAMLSYMFGSALAQSTQVLAANLMGAGNIEETDRRVRSSVAAACVVSGAVSTLLLLFARPLYSLFTKDGEILALCGLIMLIDLPLELGRQVNTIVGHCLQSCGDIRFPTTICVVSAWLTAVGGGFVLGHVCGLGLVGVWLAMALDECLRAVLFIFRWKGGKWKEKHLI